MTKGGNHTFAQNDGMSADDGDNRTRNAKAQRRHREKRKAHLKSLEDSVSVLTAQLEDARRQLGQAAYGTSSRLSPQSTKDYGQVSAENAYLRDENADLRRQIYSYRVNYGHLPPPPPGVEQGKEGGWGEVKQEGQFAVGYGQGSLDSPQRGGSVHRNGPPRQSGEIIPETSVHSVHSNAGESSSAPSSSSSYPPQIDHFTSINPRNPRGRVMSSSSAPGASPYVPPNPFPDQRYAQGPPGSGPGAVRYESMYPAPPPHSLPRVGPGMYDMSHPHPYASRPDGGEGMWAPETGPPPFQSQNPVSYQMGFAHDGQQHHGGGEEWRQDH